MRIRRLAPSAALLAAALAALLPASPSPAHADAPAEPLARHLARPGRPHPLADPSGRIPVLVPLPPGADARALGLLPVAPGFGAIHLAPPDLGAYARTPAALPLLAGPPRRPLLDVSGQLTRATAYRTATNRTGEGVIVGVIDTGFDLTHPDLRHADGRSRIAWLLQAGSPRGLHPELEDAYGCTDPDQTPCAVLAAEDIDALIAAGEEELSSARAAHGTHVASTAAGNGGLMDGTASPYVGVAPSATLILAAPSLPGEGFQDSDLLNATRFIFDRADAMQAPAVVNLSVGGDFGPHDGTSPIEQGLAAMVGEAHPGRVIVVAAGNSGALYTLDGQGPFGIHTEAHVTPSATVRVPIRTNASEQGQGYVWITFRPDDDVSVGLEGPDGSTWVSTTDPGDDAGYTGSDDDLTAAVINRLANGKSPITEATNSAVVAWDGAWDAGEITITLQGKGDAQLWLVGLGDVSTSTGLGLQFTRAIKQGTITVPASHPDLLAVGCTLNRLQWTPFGATQAITIASLGGAPAVADSACFFSSAGPTPFGVPKPEISAPGGFVAAAMATGADPREERGGLFDPPGCPDDSPCFVVDDHHAITTGTSMSSPQVAGAVALLLERDPTLTQARATRLLQAGARYPEGDVPNQTQLGPGTLDIEGAMQALDLALASPPGGPPSEEPPADPIAPALDRSWYVMSSSYARPDPTWPVWGLVELREPDGSIASDIDESLLDVRVTGGQITQALTRVEPGFFRFAVAAPRGVFGTTLTVDVLYDGLSLGARELPVGTDVWTSSGDISATSAACACATTGTSSDATRPSALAALALAALLTRRRRRRS
ncbi:S8 family serine peptidase [Chondromyces apiculatus]|uniref:Peptidase S8/S53 domain-containing protein n=1 Tax=Chondromyces apiculatus DSM 436 TaxID=1192034 RepID=A0A017T7I2_9BACT|nr:S8 family serine peptidase [Chondromyces apiculatus]EYF05218.1 Hypothetical protein CAP_3583 [Chondromyces apiculatus DSM 436]